jgi:hypothetical protein
MKAKLFLLLLVPLFALLLMIRLPAEDLPVLTPEGPSDGGVVSPSDDPSGGDKPKSDGAKGATIMTAEQGEELARKVDKLAEDQKKIIEKLDAIQKDLDFVKVSVRVR